MNGHFCVFFAKNNEGILIFGFDCMWGEFNIFGHLPFLGSCTKLIIKYFIS
jgi:hypothetical protein